MDSATSRTGKVPAWARVALGLLLASAFLPAVEGEAVAQWPSPTYAKKGTWAETLAALRVQVAGRPRLFLPQPGFPFQRPDRSEAPPPHPLVTMWTQLERDFPLECDWMLQDLAACGYPCGNPARPDQYPIRWFGPRAGTDLEKTLLLHVIEELGGRGRRFKTGMAKLERNKTPSHTQPWLELYAAACRIRRQDRLATLAAKCPAFVFTKHFNMGGSHYAFTEALSDAQSERHFVPGSSLCLLEMKNGSPVVETLLDDSTGVIRDPDVSYDGKGILFAWKKSDRLDDYHLYELESRVCRLRRCLSAGRRHPVQLVALCPVGRLFLHGSEQPLHV
jgi:hypothetical protein